MCYVEGVVFYGELRIRHEAGWGGFCAKLNLTSPASTVGWGDVNSCPRVVLAPDLVSRSSRVTVCRYAPGRPLPLMLSPEQTALVGETIEPKRIWLCPGEHHFLHSPLHWSQAVVVAAIIF